MRTANRAAVALSLLALAACPQDSSPPTNPDRLWLALDESGVDVRLVVAEPPPY